MKRSNLHIALGFQFISFLFISNSNGQDKTDLAKNKYSFQYGFSIKGILEFEFINEKPNPVFRLTADVGVGSDYLCKSIYPTINTEFQLYNGGIGSRNAGGFLNLAFDAITAFTVTTGIKNHFSEKFKNNLPDRNVPLYYFADFAIPALQNPFSNSFSLGTNLIFTTTKGKKNQRIGFINFHIENFQLSYYNDGGVPIHDIYLGDRADRYYTGGGVISLNFPNHVAINRIEISYHKHTGYSRSAFEVSNETYLDYMNYHDDSQKDFNKSLYNFKVYNSKTGLALNYAWYNNVSWDIQHRLHYALFNAFHMVKYREYGGLGLLKYYSQNYIGIK